MKTTTFAFGLGVLLAASSTGLAADATKNPKPTAEKIVYEGGPYTAIRTEKNVKMTGSHMKQTVRRNGRITDGASPVIVLDSATIGRSGAGDVKQLLFREGIHR